MSQVTRNKLDFPTPGSRNAPKKFGGRFDEVDSFLREYDTLCTAYGLDNNERFEYIVRYVKRSVREIMEGLEEYTSKDWNKFADTVRRLFDHVRTEKRFKDKDLINLVSESRKKTIRTLYEFHRYQRKFIRIGGWLLQRGKISDSEYRKNFWKGIPRSTQKKLEDRMLQLSPRLSRTVPFQIDQIIAAADHIFDISCFYDDDSSESEASESDDEDSSSTSSEEDSNDDDESEEEEKPKRSKHVTSKQIKKAKEKAQKLKSKTKIRDTPITHPPSTTSKSNKEIDEVADLIDQLGKLNIHDPTYASLYFRITQKEPRTSEFLQKPRQRTFEGSARSNSSSQNQQQSTNNGPYECFFCGEKGHGLRHCPQADVMIKAGTISRNNGGKITWSDGSTILRNGGETILTAINRELAFRSRVNVERSTSTNLIRNFRYPTSDSEYDELENREDLVFATQVYPVNHPRDEHRRKRALQRAKLDGVYPPRLPRTKVDRQEEQVKAPAPSFPKTVSPSGADQPPPPILTPSAPKIPQPQQEWRPTVIAPFEDSDDDMVIEDVLSEGDDMSMAPAAPPKKKVKKQDPESKPAPTPKIPKILPRPFPPLEQPKMKPMSKAVKEFDTDQFFQKLCGTPVTISLAEILGSSPTIAKKMQDYIRITRNPNVNAVEQTNALGRTATYDPHDARLISIRMTLDNNKTVDTLIDCGSELDIINKQTCIKSQIPIDTSASTYMRDAGQHDTRLEGKCIGIRLSAGNLVTVTDLWVGSKLPFALLLGRPWQRRNRVSIEERETGTWLCRRDPYDHKIWETCVIPARHAEDFLDSFQGNFFGHDPTAVDVYLAKKTLEPDPDNDKVAKTDNS